ncbi:flagellin N-terminal helical domain-containing protein [Algisphaera agarilytica]|uniref:Flagellin n=1 Tax=Algisphaera agarilytica TaxID=1385975 RepID=A0A7X0H9K8_9BACT|nr:flagellin [Algisphaera agarilytica]MBB6430360.1 flagellar hook-associated protein 3 FlgL [Algisphaera agarilytica]
MSSISSLSNRTSSLFSSQQALDRLQQTQRSLAEAQEQISTGQAINRVSDDPSQVASVLLIERRLLEREQEARNLDLASQTLNTADQALGEATNTLIEAKTIALSQIGVGSDADTRNAQSLVIDAQLSSLVDIANTQFNGVSVFGGNNGAQLDGQVFEKFLGGVRYIGTGSNLQTDVGAFSSQDFTSQGRTAFGLFEAEVNNNRDLDPQATGATPLSAITGGTNSGFVPGSLNVTVNATTVSVDLSEADSLDDVATILTDSITNIVPGGGAVTVGPVGLVVTGNGGNTVTISDPPGTRTAQSLGLEGVSSTGGVPTAGVDVGVQLTPLTALASLGTAVDFASGLVITQGQQTVTVDLSTATTIQDLQNTIADLDLGLRLDIAEGGQELAIVSTVAGLEFSVGENGGSTATDLGIHSFNGDTRLTDLRQGIGLITQEGEDDLSIALHDGTTFSVNLDTATTVAEAITLIDAAAGAAGVAPGDFTVAVAATGTGLVATDNTVGGSDFAITNFGQSHVAEHLGLLENAGAATTINGEDTATRRVDNAFTDLIILRDSLKNNDESGITLASTQLEDDIDSVVSARAIVGVQAQRLEETRLRNEDQTLQEQSVLSSLKDADLTEVISRYQQLQLQLQASLQTSAQIQQLSLLDFLR